jgi:hypothetical protein
MNCWKPKVMTTKVISIQAMHVTAKAARGMEGSETRARAKAVMAPRASRVQTMDGDIVRSQGNLGSSGKLVACSNSLMNSSIYRGCSSFMVCQPSTPHERICCTPTWGEHRDSSELSSLL